MLTLPALSPAWTLGLEVACATLGVLIVVMSYLRWTLRTHRLPPTPEHLTHPPSQAQCHHDVHFVVLTAPHPRGPSPGPQALVKVAYTGWNSQGEVFATTTGDAHVVPLPMAGVIKGWQLMLLEMHEGEKRRVWIPAALAYGLTPEPGHPSGPLVFEMELVQVCPPKP